MKYALVTGSNQGIGFETIRQLVKHNFHPILTARSDDDKENARLQLEEDGIQVSPYQLDVQDENSISELYEWTEEKFGKLDVLVNNAGIIDRNSVNMVSIEDAKKLIDVNLFGPWRMIKTFEPLLRRSDDPRIINVSSGSGQISSQASNTSA